MVKNGCPKRHSILPLAPESVVVMSLSSKDFNVAIVGAGMSGLTCAIGLRKAGIDVMVFEAASKFEEIGAGVNLGSNALRALDGLGLLEAVLAKINQTAPIQRPFNFISGTGDHEFVHDYAKICPGQRGIGIHRPAFLDALLPLLDPHVTKFSKRCTSVGRASSGRQVLHFADNTSYEAELVIGADGIKSVIRNAVVSDCRLHFSDAYAYRGLISIEALKSAGVNPYILSRPHCWVGLGKYLTTYPIKENTLLNIVALIGGKEGSLSPARPAPWVEVVPQQELIDAYPGWGKDASIIFQHIEEPNRWSIHTLYPPLETFVNGKVVLVGDAAHGMLPYLGAGAGQGLEDVYTLCRLLSLSTTTKLNLDVMIKAYDTIRRPRANMILERSIGMGAICSSYGPNHYSAADMRQHLVGMMEPVWFHDLEAEVTEGIDRMGLMLGSA